jgi:hypothetical protein
MAYTSGFTPSDFPQTTSDHFVEASNSSYSGRFEGDFYVEPDDAVRGITFDTHTLGGLDPFTGYETEGHFKGLNMSGDIDFGADPYQDDCKAALGPPLSFDKFDQFYDDGPSSADLLLDDMQKPETEKQFEEHFSPPPMSDDPMFHLAVTTIYVLLSGTLQTPAELGNCILNFLHTQVSASIEKVRPKKFWIKTSLFLESEPGVMRYTMCTLKVRIYRAVDGSYAIEFMRRAGDALVFNGVFQQACQYLQQHVKVVGGADVPPPAPPMGMQIPFLPDVVHEPQAVLAPVLNMAAMKTEPKLQAESAAALAEIAEQDANRLDRLCTDEVFEAVRQLLHAVHLAVLFPLARFLLQLASCSQADVLFAKHGILQEVLCKVRREKCDTSQTLATREMARVLAISVQRCAALLSREAATSFHQQLLVATQEVSSKETHKHLEDARLFMGSLLDGANGSS